MATIDFPSTVGMEIGTPYDDPISGITYIWTGVYWNAQGANGVVIPPNYEELMPIGAVLPFANGVVPEGWLLCDGRGTDPNDGILRASYPDLFNALCVTPGFTPQVFVVDNNGLFTKGSVPSPQPHGFKGGERIRLSTTDTLLTGLTVGVDYYVIYVSPTTFRVTLSKGGTAIDPTGTSQAGTHTYLQSLYGLGNGSTTFNLPDLRDEFIRGAGSIANIGAWQIDAVGPHTHPEVYEKVASGPTVDVLRPKTTSINWNSIPNVGTETRPRNVAMNYCIKAYRLVTNTELVDVQDLVQPVQQAADDATWKQLPMQSVTVGQQVLSFTDIPTTAKMIRMTVVDLSPANANNFDIMLQLGTGGSYDNNIGHYVGSCNIAYGETGGKVGWSDKQGAIVYINNDGGSENANGSIELIRHGNTNTWLLNAALHDLTSPNRLHHAAGKIDLITAINKLRVQFNNGGSPDTGFDSGSIALWYI